MVSRRPENVGDVVLVSIRIKVDKGIRPAIERIRPALSVGARSPSREKIPIARQHDRRSVVAVIPLNGSYVTFKKVVGIHVVLEK